MSTINRACVIHFDSVGERRFAVRQLVIAASAPDGRFGGRFGTGVPRAGLGPFGLAGLDGIDSRIV